MKQILSKSIVFCSLFFVSYQASAQVTIGIEETPESGALLQVKNLKNVQNGSINATKGVLLPRVEILSTTINSTYTDLSKTLNSSSTEAWDKKDLTALTVYNVREDLANNICPGLYTWDGTEWQRIGKKCNEFDLKISPTGPIYYLNSGLNGSVSNYVDIAVTWKPAFAELNVTDRKNSLVMDSVNFEAPRNLPTGLLGGSAIVSIFPNDMTLADITGINPVGGYNKLFTSKESKISFNVESDGNTATKTIIVNQTNKALLIDNSLESRSIEYTSNAQKTLNTESNANWVVTNYPPTNSPISNISKLQGGAEKYDGTSVKETISFNINTGAPNNRYAILTFSDKSFPKRFADIVLTINQCDGESDLTMVEYKNLWEEIYGVNPSADEPDSDGNIQANVNRVQWHKDQNGNIFFSAVFGGKRWMTTNLAATTIASNPSITLINSLEYGSSSAQYAYPVTLQTVNPPANDKTLYNKFQRTGLLYNWYAATALSIPNPTYDDKTTDYDPHYQGICPNGWHLPTLNEMEALQTELSSNMTKYSTHNTDKSGETSIIARDVCERSILGTMYPGTSKSLLEGGFSAFLPGYSSKSITSGRGSNSGLWSSVPKNTAQAYGMIVNPSQTLGGLQADKASMFYSVRCIKNFL